MGQSFAFALEKEGGCPNVGQRKPKLTGISKQIHKQVVYAKYLSSQIVYA